MSKRNLTITITKGHLPKEVKHKVSDHFDLEIPDVSLVLRSGKRSCPHLIHVVFARRIVRTTIFFVVMRDKE